MPDRSTPRRFNAQDALNRARKSRGLPSAQQLSFARPGAVYLVDNAKVIFPASELHRSDTPHPRRHAIVMQNMRLANSDSPVTMQVVPCSASHQGPVSAWDYELPTDERMFDAPRVVAYVSLMQPILKRYLVEYLGVLRADTVLAMQARIPLLYGLPQSPARTAEVAPSPPIAAADLDSK